jgi:GNAT superfamily N-acetyltransferase
MDLAAFRRYLASSTTAYAADKVRVGTWTAEEAAGRAQREFDALLPRGQETPGHHLRTIVDAAGRGVGVLWFGPTSELGDDATFIYDIEIESRYRGRGYGRAALEALEPLARSLGFERIGLHVFGDNEVARTLYRSAGFVETDVTMRKTIGEPRDPRAGQ